jgi:hypothetical protein
MDRVKNLGMARDIQQRRTQARVDDAALRNKLVAARRLIYEENKGIKCAGVERSLAPQSLVPTIVSFPLSTVAY